MQQNDFTLLNNNNDLEVIDIDNEDRQEDVNESYQRIIDLEVKETETKNGCTVCKKTTPIGIFFCHAQCEDLFGRHGGSYIDPIAELRIERENEYRSILCPSIQDTDDYNGSMELLDDYERAEIEDYERMQARWGLRK